MSSPPLRHGQDLTAAHVGANTQASSRRAVDGGVVRDGSRSALFRRIDDGATYDGLTVPGPHLVLADAAIDGPLDIQAAMPFVIHDVTVRVGAAHWGIHVRPGGGPVMIVRTTLIGSVRGRAGAGILARRNGTLVHRSHIRGFADGIRASASRLVVSACLIEDLSHGQGDHNDGIQLEGAPEDVVVRRCRIANRHAQTSAVKLVGNRVRVEDCHLSGGGWTIYGGARDGARDVTVTGNVLARDHFPRIGRHGPVADWSRDPARGFRWGDNRRDDGRLILP